MKNQPLSRRFHNAWNGIKTSMQSEHSFRTHIVVTALVIMLLAYTRPSLLWWALLLQTCGLVMGLELVNTAVEKLADHLHPDQHQTLKIVKDTLAGAVLVASLFAICIFIAFAISLLNS